MARRQHQRMPSWQALVLLVLLGPSTTVALSMTNFQIITSEKVSSRCMRAYSMPVSGCAVSDFVTGNQCSASCVQGLEAAAERIQRTCSSDDADDDSLLSLIVTGHLVEVLCPRNPQTTITTTVWPTTVQPTPSAGQDTGIQDPVTTIRTSSETPSPTTEPTRDDQTTSPTSTAVDGATSQPPTTDSPDTDTTTGLPTFSLGTSPTNTITPTPSTTAADDEAEPTETSDGSGSEDDDSDSNGINPALLGGGGPFDPVFVVNEGASIRHQIYGIIIASVSLVGAVAMLF